MITMRDEFTILIDAEVGHIIGRQPRFWVECGGKGVCTETDIMGRSTCIDDGALAIWKRLVKGKACQTIAKGDDGRRQEVTDGAAGIEAVPLREHTRYQEHDKGGMEDKCGKRCPGLFVGVEIDELRGRCICFLLRRGCHC